MFGINFPELLVCLVVALIFIGPEQLPETVRTIGLWIGRLKRSLRSTREEFERQIGMDDIRRQLHNEEIMRKLEDARKELDAAIEEQKNTIHSVAQMPETIYGSEPDLPYHSHMDDPNHGKTENLLHEDSTQNNTAQLADSSQTNDTATTESNTNNQHPNESNNSDSNNSNSKNSHSKNKSDSSTHKPKH